MGNIKRFNSQRAALLHKSYLVILFLKGLISAIEIAGGATLFIVTPSMINRLVVLITRHELSEDPHDFLFGHLLQWSQHFSVSSETFVALYLTSHGIIKLFIVASLWKGKLWAYPAGIVFFLIFIAYQLYRFEHTHAWSLIALTVFDIILIYLTWIEYRRVENIIKKQRTA